MRAQPNDPAQSRHDDSGPPPHEARGSVLCSEADFSHAAQSAGTGVKTPAPGQDELAIRLMHDAPDDYAQLARWLSDERVLEYYEGRDNAFSLERIREEYSPRVLGREDVTPCFIERNGAPIGYIQYYRIDAETAGKYEIPLNDKLYGLDQFIGEPALWNLGLGTRAVSLLCDYLFGTQGAQTLTLDPAASNTRAIRCYEKCGFRKLKLLLAAELHEGQQRDCWLMIRQA